MDRNETIARLGSKSWTKLSVLVALLGVAPVGLASAQEETTTTTTTTTTPSEEGGETTTTTTTTTTPAPAPAPTPPPAPPAPPPAAAATFQAQTAARPASDADDTVWTLNLGSTLVTGNARTFQLSAGTHLQLIRDQHMFTGDLNFTYGMAATRTGTDPVNNQPIFTDMNANAQNLLGKIRYDFFLTEDDSIFAVQQLRNDPFAGLDLRSQTQAGYSRNFLREAENKHRFWGEIGFDYTHDERTLARLPAGTQRTEDVFAGRLFVGYDNHMNDTWQFLTGLEGLYGINNADKGDLRLNSTTELRLTVATNLQASAKFTLLYDRVPVPGATEVDTATVLGIIYTLM